MDDRRYNVVFKGEIHEQATLSLVQERLAAIFKADVENIKVMFSKKRTIVKKNAPYEMCQKVEQGFLNAGAFVDIEEVTPEGFAPEAVGQSLESEYSQEPAYTADQEYIQEADPQYEAEQEAEYSEEPSLPQEPEYEPESVPEAEPLPADPEPVLEAKPVPEPEVEPDPEPEIVAPEASLNTTAPTLQMENEQQKAMPEIEEFEIKPEKIEIEPEEVEIEPEDEIDGSDRNYGPPPDYKPGGVVQPSEMDTELENEIDEPGLGYAPLPEYDSDLEPEFEIVEDESEFEIVGLESDIDPEIDDDFEFDNLAPIAPENIDVVEEEIEENPYAAPQANLEQEDLNLGDFVYPQKRPFKNGFRWLVSGFNLFKQAKLTWIISVFIFMLISTIAGLIPFIGAIVSNIFNPVFLAGFIIGAKEQDEGGKLKIGHVFAGFSSNFGQLVLFGLLYFVTILLVFGFIGVVFILIFIAGGFGSVNFADPSSLAALSNMSPLVFLVIMLVGMLITIPIMMAYYFGPALISVNQITIFEAVKMSFKGCLRNMLPFFLYGLACTVLFILVIAVFIGIAVLVGMLMKEAGMIVGAIGIIIIIFTVTPIFIASTYAAYKDIFYAE